MMIFLIIIASALYFILPVVFVMIILEKYDYKIWGYELDIHITGWGMIFVELAFFIQILKWISDANVL